ncbi:nitroreductase [Saccharothrix coeruleofusca]|uniref:nitroreductase family protein n=1 Tax=Saccharothrix coeruleofusca TaxID=33919 RepID=UPI001AE91461|nr:nitroreductase family protein [Saccharothrix coeruleofusca]MBP2340237.1 nitroreductase [Saccharothrix coeruleofusca]
MELNRIIADRWSPRAFDGAVELDDGVLRVLLEAARWAPSHGNTQPARYLLGRRGDDTFGRIFGALSRGNRTWAGRASALVVGAVVTSDERGEVPNAEYGLGLAVQNLVLQAVHLGLVAHQMGGFDKDAVRAEFALPEEVRPVVVIALGELGDSGELPEDLRARERRPRTRKPLEDLVFTGTWGRRYFRPDAQPSAPATTDGARSAGHDGSGPGGPV